MLTHGVPLTDANVPVSRAQGIFSHRLLDQAHSTVSAAITMPADLPIVATTADSHPVLEEADYSETTDYSEDSGLEDSSSEDSDSDF